MSQSLYFNTYLEIHAASSMIIIHFSILAIHTRTHTQQILIHFSILATNTNTQVTLLDTATHTHTHTHIHTYKHTNTFYGSFSAEMISAAGRISSSRSTLNMLLLVAHKIFHTNGALDITSIKRLSSVTTSLTFGINESCNHAWLIFVLLLGLYCPFRSCQRHNLEKIFPFARHFSRV